MEKLTEKEIRQLIKMASEMRNRSYVPFSNWTVGAALLCKDGTIFTGCNIENSSYTPTVCAERTAIFKAISEGFMDFKAIAVVGGVKGEVPQTYCAPCGVCRQVMQEFCDKDFQIIVAKTEDDYIMRTQEEILPLGFNL